MEDPDFKQIELVAFKSAPSQLDRSCSFYIEMDRQIFGSFLAQFKVHDNKASRFISDFYSMKEHGLYIRAVLIDEESGECKYAYCFNRN